MASATKTAMGRPKGKRTERSDAAVKIDKALASKARLIAAHEGTSVAELLSEIVRPHIDRRFAQMLRELEGKEGGE